MRSLLFVPGNSALKLEKASRSGADALIFDLEDAVPPGQKEEARTIVADALSASAVAPAVYVRVNGLSTPWWEDDLRSVLPARPAGIVLPKPDGPEDVERLSRTIGRFEPPGADTGIIAICTETASGTLSLAARSWKHARLRGLMWGGEDLTVALGGSASRAEDGSYREPIRLARSLCLMAARAANVVPIDAVHVDYADTDGLLAEVLEARRDGFTAKAAIHPRQIDTIHSGFAPSQAEIGWARKVIDAMGRASSGVAVVDGKMVDAPHLALARSIMSHPPAR